MDVLVSKFAFKFNSTYCTAYAAVLVYCWRGGERSLSLAHTLSRVGFHVVGLYKFPHSLKAPGFNP
jgi:hypothetical protein